MDPILKSTPQPQPMVTQNPAPVVQTSPDMTFTKQTSNEYPIQVSIEYPDKQSRLLALFSIPFFLVRTIMLIPQIIVLYFILIASEIVAWVNFFYVLFTGHSSKGMHNFIVGSLRWSTRVSAYLYGLTDKYPPFRLRP